MTHTFALLALSLFAAYEPTPPNQAWELSLADAIRIGLQNDESTRVISLEGAGAGFSPGPTPVPPAGHMFVVVGGNLLNGLAIAPAKRGDAEGEFTFKAEVMAGVRAFEALYWDLVAQHVRLQEYEKAVHIAEELIKREASEPCCGCAADIAEAEERLEQFREALKSHSSDTKSADNRLRNALGLPPVDDPRINPTSIPPANSLTPDRRTAATDMLDHHPGIARQKRLVDRSMLGVCCSRDQLWSEAVGLGSILGTGRHPFLNVRQSQYVVQKEREVLDLVVTDAVQLLVERVREADSNYRSHETAVTARKEAGKHLAAQWTSYEEGRVTIDRYLTAVSRFADAVSEEARTAAAYQTSLADVEEAKGTILESRQVFIVDPPKSPKRVAALPGGPNRDAAVGRASAPTAPVEPAAPLPATSADTP